MKQLLTKCRRIERLSAGLNEYSSSMEYEKFRKLQKEIVGIFNNKLYRS